MDAISPTYGEQERMSQRRASASIAGNSIRSALGNQARHSSRNARARAPPSMARRRGPPSRTSVTGMLVSRLIAACCPEFAMMLRNREFEVPIIHAASSCSAPIIWPDSGVDARNEPLADCTTLVTFAQPAFVWSKASAEPLSNSIEHGPTGAPYSQLGLIW